MVALITILILLFIFRLTKLCFSQVNQIENQKQLIENMTRWEEKYKSDKKEEFLADMDAQDPKWGKHKI